MRSRSSASIRGARRTSERRVTTSAQAAACDQAAIAAGTPSFALMLQAGTATASLILRDYAGHLTHGVVVLAGTGNNGGDAYVVAAQLARAGVRVRVHAIDAPRTDDARRAASLLTTTLSAGNGPRHAPLVETVDDSHALLPDQARLVIDGLLGTGQHGPLRDAVRQACDVIHRLQQRGALVMALDVPTGLDASTGELADGAVRAECTACYGTLKRGLLMQRAHAGRVVLLDIGLGLHAEVSSQADPDTWCWYDATAVAAQVPAIAWDAHKGRRGRVLVAGGEMGMAGAAVYAARAALLAGAGVVHALVDTQSVPAVQALCAAALAHRWPALDNTSPHTSAAHALTPVGTMRPDIAVDAVAVGPGLGRSRRAGQLLQHVVARHRTVPMVLDADALWHAADAAQTLGIDAATVLSHWTRDMMGARAQGDAAVVCTPHPGEFARLTGAPLPTSWQARADLLQQFATRAGVTMLLKGTPTLVASPGVSHVSVVPHGTALLATGGSGDCLTGMIGTLLAQGLPAHEAAVVGATVHGRAAELATARAGAVRGTTLEDLLGALPEVWHTIGAVPVRAPYVLAELPGL
ncbi:NAD(P)H-hydrate dehydratase [Gemmatimonas aurantiaca]|uniref:NAD(P)H-hydrate dehydratase n=1 Tax=Gemmatimonas aurantiaca TaxID=173480 RepID=UPI00145C8688|nr:NAD(P)H-hydrate dehydratase [Gemmatimonas aurantiaca]